jgi:glycosyltransferase involved in cell wall biosynthesis
MNYHLAHLAQMTPFQRLGVLNAASIVEQRLKRILPLLKEIDLIVAPSSWMKEVLVMNGASPDRIMVSVYGLQTDQSAPLSRKPHSPLRFGFLGRIHSMKGVDVLIDAFNRLPAPRDATLDIYGSPSPDQFEYAGRLWSMAKANPRITFGKQVGQEQLASVFESLDVLIVPSIWYENSPISVLEALHHRTPVIASQVAGMADVIQHEENGLLFRRGDASDLTSQMQRLIDRPELVEQLSSQMKAVKSIRQDAEILMDKYETLPHLTGMA